MRCSKANWQLQLYLDRQLSQADFLALEAHLSTCSDCRTTLHALEEITRTFDSMQQVPEPADLTANIMQRVSLNVQKKEQPRVRESSFVLLRPSLQELLAAVLLATVSTLGLILVQPTLRTILPIANGHDAVSMLFISFMQGMTTMNASTLSVMLWVIGTFLGIWITLALAGNEMRTEWYKAVMDRLPVW